MRYFPHTDADLQRMLDKIGRRDLEALFETIPPSLRLDTPLDLPPSLSESEVFERLCCLGAKNLVPGKEVISFLGGGLYPRFVSAAVDLLAQRGEFLTAYTPYQPELSQGTLMAAFEFQTIVCELYGTDFANASMYDGASATAEAISMARRLTGRRKALLLGGLHPEYVQVCQTYFLASDSPGGTSIEHMDTLSNGVIDADKLGDSIDEDTACVVAQSPNFFGLVENISEISKIAHEKGALSVTANCDPVSLAVLKPPGKCGADIVVGDGSSLGNHPMLGGPGLGLFGANGARALRSMPGRIVGKTVDRDQRPGYVLTLATREQHIRRSKATSSICTNHGLMALRFAIQVSLLGKQGLLRLARLNLAKAHYARSVLLDIPGFEERFTGPFFNEFTLRVPAEDATEICEAGEQQGILVGLPLGRFKRQLKDTLLISVTEGHTREEIERLAEVLRQSTGR